MKNFYLLYLLILVSTSYSQKLLDTVDYNEFKAYNIRYNALNLNGNASGLRSLDGQIPNRNDISFGANFYNFKNSERSQSSLGCSAYMKTIIQKHFI